MTFKPGDKVRLKRDIYRYSPELETYAEEGDTGEIVEIFYPSNSSAMAPKIPHAKVLIDDKIKTFRLSSIEKLNNKEK
jgi:hypothetical protein